MADIFRNAFILVAVVALLLLASGCSKSSADAGLALPEQAVDADQPPALPQEDDSLPSLPSGDGSSGGVPLFG